MAEHTSSLNVDANVKSDAYLMDQRVINARLDRLESSLEGISRAMDSLTRSVDRLLHAQAIGVSGSGSDAQMPAPSRSPSFCHHQQERLTKDQEEKENEKNEEVHVIQKKKEEADLYTFVKVARDEDLTRQSGRDIYFDLFDHDKVKCFRVKKQMPFMHFKDEVAKEFGIPVQFMRFWLWGKRQNHTYRPNRLVTHHEETQSVGQLRKVANKVHNVELKLYLEVELGPDLHPIAPPEKTKDDILLFFKLYDPEKEELRYVGRLFVKGSGNPSEILTKLNEMAVYHPEEEIALFEEIRFEPSVICEPIDMELSYSGNELEDGDIICFQKAIRLPDVPSYLTYLHKHRQQEDEEMLVPHSDLTEKNHQTMEVVAQAESASTVESQPVEDPSSSRFTWRIDNFSWLITKKLYSETFIVGGYKWRVLIFPKGNNVDYLSMYLDVADSSTLPYGWSRYAQFSLAVINQMDDKYSVRKDTQHQFNVRESDWGFTSFMPVGELCDPSRGYLVNDALIVEAEVLVRSLVDYWSYDSKKETGCVGLKNQGATGYMNSVLHQKEKEEKEHKKKEKDEAHLYTIIKVARDKNLAEQIGKDIYFDLVDHDKVKCFRVQKQMSFNVFKDEVGKAFCIPVQFMRFWLWGKRQNHTYRPNRPVTHLEETQSVGQLRKFSNKVHNAELKLYLEVELGPDLRPIAPQEKTKDDILLFFKLYDPEKEELRYVGRLFVKGSGNPSEILTKLNEMAGYHPKEEIALFEEIRFQPRVMCEPIDMELSYSGNQLEDGDIICFQKAIRLPDVPSYLTYLHKHRVSFIGVQFKQCVCLPHV